MVHLPLCDRLIPIITDEYPDPDFGSGAVKITGAHDQNDYGVAQRNNIPMYRLMDEVAAMRADGLGMGWIHFRVNASQLQNAIRRRIDPDGKLAGIFTDGDLRRVLDRGIDVHGTPMREVMTPRCKTIAPGVLAAEAVHLLEQYKINGLLVVDDSRRVVGALNIHDLLRAGVM